MAPVAGARSSEPVDAGCLTGHTGIHSHCGSDRLHGADALHGRGWLR